MLNFCNFVYRNERNWMKKSARVSEKLVSPGLPGLQVATRLIMIIIMTMIIIIIIIIIISISRSFQLVAFYEHRTTSRGLGCTVFLSTG